MATKNRERWKSLIIGTATIGIQRIRKWMRRKCKYTRPLTQSAVVEGESALSSVKEKDEKVYTSAIEANREAYLRIADFLTPYCSNSSAIRVECRDVYLYL